MNAEKSYLWMIEEARVLGLRREIRESLVKEDERANENVSDGTVSEARVFESYNVNLRSASDVKL